jgi:hypothetical protein
MKFTINQSTIEKVITYLAGQPYREVAALIAEIQRDVKPVEEAKAAEKESNNNDTVSH